MLFPRELIEIIVGFLSSKCRYTEDGIEYEDKSTDIQLLRRGIVHNTLCIECFDFDCYPDVKFNICKLKTCYLQSKFTDCLDMVHISSLEVIEFGGTSYLDPYALYETISPHKSNEGHFLEKLKIRDTGSFSIFKILFDRGYQPHTLEIQFDDIFMINKAEKVKKLIIHTDPHLFMRTDTRVITDTFTSLEELHIYKTSEYNNCMLILPEDIKYYYQIIRDSGYRTRVSIFEDSEYKEDIKKIADIDDYNSIIIYKPTITFNGLLAMSELNKDVKIMGTVTIYLRDMFKSKLFPKYGEMLDFSFCSEIKKLRVIHPAMKNNEHEERRVFKEIVRSCTNIEEYVSSSHGKETRRLNEFKLSKPICLNLYKYCNSAYAISLIKNSKNMISHIKLKCGYAFVDVIILILKYIEDSMLEKNLNTITLKVDIKIIAREKDTICERLRYQIGHVLYLFMLIDKHVKNINVVRGECVSNDDALILPTEELIDELLSEDICDNIEYLISTKKITFSEGKSRPPKQILEHNQILAGDRVCDVFEFLLYLFHYYSD